jgi:uncharacterized cupin superfamily protein
MSQGRLVVTGHRDGRSVVVRDVRLDAIHRPGVGYSFRYWSANEPFVYPSSGEDPEAQEYFPPVGGARFFSTTLVPQDGRPASDQVDDEQLGSPSAELAKHMETDEPGMHTTDSTDFVLVSSGQVELELDDGGRAVLGAGDVVVQNGTRHRWRVLGDEPVTLTIVCVGAYRA